MKRAASTTGREKKESIDEARNIDWSINEARNIDWSIDEARYVDYGTRKEGNYWEV